MQKGISESRTKKMKQHKKQMENNLFTLDVSQWQSGFYSIVVNTAEGREIYKSSTKIKN